MMGSVAATWRRGGYVLAELAVYLVLAGAFTAVLLAALVSEQRLARTLAGRAADADAVRVASTVLAGEARYLDPIGDLLGLARDTLALRAIRGVGIVCRDDEGRPLVRYRGMREPDPAKDQVIPAVGGGAAAALTASARVAGAAGCAARDGEEIYRWSVASDLLRPGAVLVLFETGSYHLAADLRYRRGAAGRQPITAPRFDSTATRLERVVGAPPAPRGGGYAAGPAGAGDGAEGTGGTGGATTAVALRVRLALPNGPGKSGAPGTSADRESPGVTVFVPFLNVAPPAAAGVSAGGGP